MSGKVVNLRRERKQRARARERASADANAARHGEAKPVKILRNAREGLEKRRLDGHWCEDSDEPG